MFWKKRKPILRPDFKLGDVVKLKKGTKHDLLDADISDWRGRIFEIHETEVELELDSITLKGLTKEILDVYVERQEDPHILYVPFKDIEISEPRDEEKEVEKVQDLLIEKIDAENGIPKFRRDYSKWVRHFQRDNAYKSMSKKHRKHTDFILDTFLNYMYDYQGRIPQKWNLLSVKEVLLHYVPTKISAEKEVFAVYGDVLLAYFKFLQERRYVGTKSLQQLVIKVKDKIVENSQDSSTWGPAKTLIMKAINAGVDMDDEKAVKRFMIKEQAKTIFGLSRNKK